ncbi:guanosine polyphosphate pyrophosphohydrolase [Pseudonocardia spinosispora]|uniref:guanosine polyphosphate pyrophosphohydrolase n=1 Tax=Pseudonocardia spinosispora TaxID=103441 RepID=UPI000411516F|nr:guanosine polyphosphate pyrophosphohydrolase [Pseudonocardia spinosispora]
MTASSAGVGTTLLVIYTESLDQCRAFYQGLGLCFVGEQHGAGPRHWAAVLAGGMVLELYPATTDRVTRHVRLGFSVPASAPDPPLPVGRHLRTDPDGRTVEVEVH